MRFHHTGWSSGGRKEGERGLQTERGRVERKRQKGEGEKKAGASGGRQGIDMWEGGVEWTGCPGSHPSETRLAHWNATEYLAKGLPWGCQTPTTCSQEEKRGMEEDRGKEEAKKRAERRRGGRRRRGERRRRG
jgi:hypothetical protein